MLPNSEFDDHQYYLPDPLLVFVAQGHHPSPERLVELLLEELGITLAED